MARPRYQITASDLTHAWQYLTDRVQLQLIELEDESKREFWDISTISGRDRRATALNTWCDANLTAVEWTKLKSAIRKRRNRLHGSDRVTITISRSAYTALKKLAEKRKVSLAQQINTILGL